MSAPLLRSTSWADVEDEQPPPSSSVPPKQNWDDKNPVVRKIEQRPFKEGEKRFPEPRQVSTTNSNAERQSHSKSYRQNHKPVSNEQRKLWEPFKQPSEPKQKVSPPQVQVNSPKEQSNDNTSSATLIQREATNIKEASDNNESHPKEKKPPKDNGKKNKKKNFHKFELHLKFIPQNVNEEDVKSLFEQVLKVKRVEGERMYVQFPSKAAMEKALTVSLPKWGQREVQVSVATNLSIDAKKNSLPKDKIVENPPVISSKSNAPQSIQEKSQLKTKKSGPKKKGVQNEVRMSNDFAALAESSDEEGEDD